MPAADLRQHGAPCRACDGKGTVLAIDGQPRPCSRCNHRAFDRWADARRPGAKSAAAPETPPDPDKRSA